MDSITEYIAQLPGLVGIFILMLSSFLIGYFSGWWLQKGKSRSFIKKLKGEVNAAKSQQKVNDIETIFTEIKPKIVEVVKQTQKEIVNPEDVLQKTRTSFVTYTKDKPKLDFETIGVAHSFERDDLTKIDGIGPYIEEKLNETGIYTYAQISRLTPSNIRALTEIIDFFPGRIERDNWVGQAKSLIAY
ncbi:hypothetical protein [Marixanthomonas spongiae]|uniref:Uncharacterized protein n=1 Tax=Marixanthomonas spongiae TaxID=2174845 RepID=A0A2U0HY94_9FLAO|nr:hypothetical protein [Marixanthomonas spongiae]PVW13808.1 hypothetical protein DDV96_11665 [Marixanthomonas spongiae]